MTSTEITQQSGEGLSVLPKQRPMSTSAVDMLMKHAEAMQTAREFADIICRTPMVPAIYRGKPDDSTAAILYGAELGLNPLQSLQNIFPVHGMPSMYAKTMAALVKQHGYKIAVEESTDESVTVLGVAPDGQSERSTWTIERATKAGYVPTTDEKTGRFKTNQNGKLIGNEKYLTQPREMLYAKAVTEVCRHLAPDVLLGIAYSYEELVDEHGEDTPRRVSSTVAASQSASSLQAQLRANLGGAQGATPEAQPEPESEPKSDQTPAAAEPAADAPTKDQYARLASYFKMADLDGKTAAVKAKREQVTSKLLDRNDFTDNPLTGAEVERVISLLDQINNEGEGVLKAALDDLVTQPGTDNQENCA